MEIDILRSQHDGEEKTSEETNHENSHCIDDTDGERKSFFIRNDGIPLNEVRLWAGDELRSLNGQTEFILRAAVKDRGRLKKPEPEIERRASIFQS